VPASVTRPHGHEPALTDGQGGQLRGSAAAGVSGSRCLSWRSVSAAKPSTATRGPGPSQTEPGAACTPKRHLHRRIRTPPARDRQPIFLYQETTCPYGKWALYFPSGKYLSKGVHAAKE
jgi:hypothetical protein